MIDEEESLQVREAVAATFRDAGFAWPPSPAGPMPLAEMIAVHNVIHEEVDRLNRAAASAVLRRWNVRWTDFPPDDPPLAGFCYANSRCGFLFVRRGDILPRRRFTAAHELGHYRLHLGPALAREVSEMVEVDGDEQVEESGQGELTTMERQANRFAAELLMPESVCRELHERYSRKYGAIDRYLVYHLAGDLLVSRAAIAFQRKIDIPEDDADSDVKNALEHVDHDHEGRDWAPIGVESAEVDRDEAPIRRRV